jgi:hypothetical protein
MSEIFLCRKTLLLSFTFKYSFRIEIDFKSPSVYNKKCVRSSIVEVKRRSQRSVIGWVTKSYYLELHLAWEC